MPGSVSSRPSMRLNLTTAPNWGHQLRRGLVALTADDAAVLRESMLPAVAR